MRAALRRVGVVATVALALLAGGLVADLRPAHAASSLVMLDVSVAHPWSIEASRSFVDQYTGSAMAYGACRAGYRCVVIRERTVYSSWAAVTYWDTPTYGSAIIYLNPQRAWYGWYTKRQIVTHELGHAFGIHWHVPYCSQGIMYPSVFCSSGYLPPYRFTAYQRYVLSLY